MLVPVASAANDVEAQMIASRLRDAGIEAVTKGTGIPQLGVSGTASVYVEEHLEARARNVLATAEFSDEELTELSEQAARDAE
jgi:hypothetical protein